MVLEVKWKRINDILLLKHFRNINAHHTFIHKIMTFADLKGLVSKIFNTKLYHR